MTKFAVINCTNYTSVGGVGHQGVTYHRPLTYEEVILARNHSIWRRSRLILVLIFWATIAMFLSIVACLIFNSRCNVEMASPGVPPVHLTLAPIMASVQKYKEAYME